MFRRRVCLKKPDNISKKDFETFLTECLYSNYPNFKQTQEMFCEINEKYFGEYPDLKVKFKPSFTWNKEKTKVTKIGIRATNYCCNAKKEDDENYIGQLKSEVLRTYNFVYEKDVKSSVPRITFLLNNGVWLDESVDIYELIFNHYLEIKYPNGLKKQFDFNNSRKAVKGLHMRCYFDNSGQLAYHTWDATNKKFLYGNILNEMSLLRTAIYEIEGGKFYDNEIFYYESVIYGKVLKHLLDEGFFVWMCYDAFYSTAKDGWTQQRFEAYVASLVEAYANQYIAELKSAENFNEIGGKTDEEK